MNASSSLFIFFFNSSFHLLLLTVFNEGKIVLSKSFFSLSMWTIRMFCFVFSGAFFLQEMGKQFEKLFLEPDYGSGKRMENILLIISNIYNFKVGCFIFSWKWNDVKFTFVQCILCITLVWKNWNEWWKQLPWFNSTFLCFQMVHSRIIFDIMNKFITEFGERDIELLLLMLKSKI